VGTLAVGLLALATSANAPSRHALLIGVNDYRSDRLSRLEYASADVTDLAAVLRRQGYRVTLVTDSGGEAVTRGRILEAMEAALKPVAENDTVLVGLSGHGLEWNGKAYFCPSDAAVERPLTLLAVDDLFNELKNLAKGPRAVLVDACRDTPGKAKGWASTGALPVPCGTAVLFGCSQGETAAESPDLGHGVFFHHVIERLKAAANEPVSLDDLARHLHDVVPQTAQKVAGSAQTPNMITNGCGGTPMLVGAHGIVTRRANAAPAAPGWVPPVRMPAADDPQAKFRQARDAQFGRNGVPLDLARAGQMFLALADDGYTPAMTALAGMALDEPNNRATADAWLRRAIASDGPAADFARGLAASNGLAGAGRNPATAVAFVQRAAEAGHPEAMGDLGGRYERGDGVPANDFEAVRWHRRAAAAGHQCSQYRLGLLTEAGRGGLAADPKAAIGLIHRGAVNGCENAQFELGTRLLDGRAVWPGQDGMDWVRKAAARGHKDARRQVGW
jgi:hypothetical protein